MSVKKFTEKKFSFGEMFAQNNGKTSAELMIGFWGAIVALIMFIVLVIFYMTHVAEGTMIIELLHLDLTLFGLSIGLLSVRQISSSLGGNKVTIQNTTNADGSITRQRTMTRRYAQSPTPEKDMETIGTDEYDNSSDGYSDFNAVEEKVEVDEPEGQP